MHSWFRECFFHIKRSSLTFNKPGEELIFRYSDQVYLHLQDFYVAMRNKLLRIIFFLKFVLSSFQIIYIQFRDLVPFAEFKNFEKHPWRSDTFNKVAG